MANFSISGKLTVGGATTLSSLTASRVLITDANKNIAVSKVTSTELGYLTGVKSAIQAQLNNKAPSNHTHTATQVTGLAPGRALVSDSSGQLTVSTVTSTELGYLDGVTFNIQSQLNNKTDTKVTNTLATTTKAYLTGTTSATTNTGTQVFDTGVYLDTIAGRLRVGSLDIGGGVMSYSSSTQTFSV